MEIAMDATYWMTDIFLDEPKIKFKFVEVETGNYFFRYIDEIEHKLMLSLRKKDISTIKFMLEMEQTEAITI
tara:strand:- start:373 stop:588 length:216 start_codon:yes stop_codon:yes gene_type:complete